MQNILVLTYGEDPHTESVCNYLSGKGIDFFVIDTECLPDRYKLTFDSESSLYKINKGNRKVVISPLWNIWNRRVMNPDVRKITPRSLTDIIFDETEKAWDGLLMSHQGKVINRPQNQLHANNKIDQLKLALTIGEGIFIPDTIVTNDSDRVRDFYEKHNGNICFKLHKGAVIDAEEGNKMIYTNKVTRENMENVELVSSHPCIFQEYINKEFEIRIISTDRNSTGIAIHSQDSEISKVDYRRYDFKNVPYEHIELPENIERFCSSMLRHYGLHFGVFDFIYSKDREYIFLELNPNGQWLWLELKSGHNLTELVAENLIE